MTKSTRNQFDYTEGILQAAGRDASEYSSVLRVWWWNPTNTANLRLTKPGIQYIKKFTRIPVYTIELSSPLLSKHLVILSRVCFCPYYIPPNSKIIELLGQEEATMLTLHAGDLGQYLDNLSI